MMTFGGTPRHKVGQSPSRDAKQSMIAYSNVQETATRELANLNALKASVHPSFSL
jgi:hypothetical protein